MFNQGGLMHKRKRREQIDALRAHGATDAEIQIVMGTGTEPFAPNKQTIRKNLAQQGWDTLAMTADDTSRLLELAAIAERIFNKEKRMEQQKQIDLIKTILTQLIHPEGRTRGDLPNEICITLARLLNQLPAEE
jgi:hypothetical protein